MKDIIQLDLFKKPIIPPKVEERLINVLVVVLDKDGILNFECYFNIGCTYGDSVGYPEDMSYDDIFKEKVADYKRYHNIKKFQKIIYKEDIDYVPGEVRWEQDLQNKI